MMMHGLANFKSSMFVYKLWRQYKTHHTDSSIFGQRIALLLIKGILHS